MVPAAWYCYLGRIVGISCVLGTLDGYLSGQHGAREDGRRVFYLASVVGLAAAVGWGYCIGSVDWGTSLPGWGLWWMTFSIGSAIGLSLLAAVHARPLPEDDQLAVGVVIPTGPILPCRRRLSLNANR
jgi:hypothetical protein